ncbi:hypothetical protein HY967_00575 [Candidatus Jorgensenbacteria bacterium]|nr:hypothetical protein [Candidatus Jorgensenbacteria bacterium]
MKIKQTPILIICVLVVVMALAAVFSVLPRKNVSSTTTHTYEEVQESGMESVEQQIDLETGADKERASQTTLQNEKSPSSQEIYINPEYKFSVSYPKSIGEFEDRFPLSFGEHLQKCTWYDPGHEIYDEHIGIGEYPVSPDFKNSQCSIVHAPFNEYIKELFVSRKPSTAINAKYFKISNSTNNSMYGFFWEIPLHGATPESPQIGWSEVRYIIVEPPNGVLSENRALQFFLEGGSRSCPNAICEPGESELICPADCRESWADMINQIFSTLKFQ